MSLLLPAGRRLATILNALSSPHAYPISTIASPDDSMTLRVGNLFLFDSSTSSCISSLSEITTGAQHSIALPIMRFAKRPDSAGSASPVIPNDRGTVHLLGVIEYAEALGRVQNPLSWHHPHINRTVDGLNVEGRIDGVLTRASDHCRLSVSQCDADGLERASHCEDVSVSWQAGASTSRAAYQWQPYPSRSCRCSHPRSIQKEAVSTLRTRSSGSKFGAVRSERKRVGSPLVHVVVESA